MEDTDLLEALDRRAGRAVAALDAGVADLEPAPLPTGPRRRQRPAWLPLLVAAGLVVVALLGAGLLLADQGDEDGTIADDGAVPVETDDGAITRLALADPDAFGYEVRAAFDGPAIEPEPGMEAMGEHRFLAHGPSGAPDPWAGAIVSMTVPVDDHTFIGELVDVGGPEASHLAVGPVDHLVWRAGGEAHRLVSGRVRGADLVRIASAAVAAGWSGAGPLPGHTVLREVTPDEFALGLEYVATVPTPWQGVAYEAAGAPDRGFVIAVRPGGPDALQGLHALEPSPRTVTIEGHEVAISGGWRRATHASWLLDDGTVVQLATYADIDAVLDAVVGALEPITDEALDELVAAHPVPSGAVILDQPASAFAPMGDGPSVASVSLRDGTGTEHRLGVLREGPDALALMLESDDGGSGGPLRDLQTPFVSGGGHAEGPYVVSGVLPAGVPGDLAGARFVDRTTGEELTVADFVTSPLDGAGTLLAIVLLDADPEVARVDATFPTPDGERTWRL